MTTTIKEQDGTLVATFEGRLDTAAAPEAEKAMAPLTQGATQDIVLDCTRLEYISSSGLRLFLGVLKAAKAQGRHVYLTGLNPDLRNVFTITGFINLFELL